MTFIFWKRQNHSERMQISGWQHLVTAPGSQTPCFEWRPFRGLVLRKRQPGKRYFDLCYRMVVKRKWWPWEHLSSCMQPGLNPDSPQRSREPFLLLKLSWVVSYDWKRPKWQKLFLQAGQQAAHPRSPTPPSLTRERDPFCEPVRKVGKDDHHAKLQGRRLPQVNVLQHVNDNGQGKRTQGTLWVIKRSHKTTAFQIERVNTGYKDVGTPQGNEWNICHYRLFPQLGGLLF